MTTKLKTLLVPTDFGAPANAALDYAIDFASTFGGSEIILLHAFEIPSVGFPDARLALAEEFRQRVLDEIDTSLERILSTRRDNTSVPIRLCVEQGNAVDIISDLALRENVDMIVMGTHGRQGLSRALLGSVAEQVVRSAPVPVLTIHTPPPPTRSEGTAAAVG